jgi:hypothetical protein
VAGQAEAARLGQPLTAHQQQVRLLRQPMQDLKDRWCFVGSYRTVVEHFMRPNVRSQWKLT